MSSTAWLPEEMSTAEIMEIISGVNLFNEPSDSLASLCYDELSKREKKDTLIVISEIDTTETDLMTEAAEIRSGLINSVGRSVAHRIRNSGTADLSEKEIRDLATIADSMNIEYWEHSLEFNQKYSTSGQFHYDDIVGIITSVKNLRETQDKISCMKQEARLEFDAFCEFVEEVFVDEESEETEERTKSGGTTPHHNILVVSAKNEKCSKTFQEFNENWFVMNYYKIEDKELKLMRKMQLQAPKQFLHAARFTVNDMARDLRGVSIKDIKSTMVVRNPSIIRKSVTYTRAKPGPINQMFSVVGSKATDVRFTGLGEQEGVRTHQRKRYITKKGRGRKRQKLARARRYNNKFLNISEQARKLGSNGHKRSIAMASRLYREGKLGRYGDPKIFIQSERPSGSRLPKGMMTFSKAKSGDISRKRGKRPAGRARTLQVLQVFPKNVGDLQPKLNPWLRRSTERYLKTSSPQKHFRRNMKKQVTLMRKYRK
jgi:hypothetical protein